MTWTTTPPTEPGYYWATFHNHPGPPTIIRLIEDGEGGWLVLEMGSDGAFPDMEGLASWAGPILPPGDAQMPTPVVCSHVGLGVPPPGGPVT